MLDTALCWLGLQRELAPLHGPRSSSTSYSAGRALATPWPLAFDGSRLGGANAPTLYRQSQDRSVVRRCAWRKALSAALSYAINSTGTVKGASSAGAGGASRHQRTTLTAFQRSAYTFSTGDKAVVNGRSR